jgi:surface carbohydrate biosynthesis protein
MGLRNNSEIKSPVIYLMLEIEKRELPARLFLAKHLLTRFSKVIIFQHSDLNHISMFSKPGIIIFKSLPKVFEPSVVLLKRRGFTILLHHEEGLHLNDSSTTDISISNNELDKIEHYFAWQKFDKDFAIRMGIPEEKISVVGNVRFQIASQMQKISSPPLDQLKILVLENIWDLKEKPSKKPKKNNDEILKLIEDNKLINQNNSRNRRLYHDLYVGLRQLKVEFSVRNYSYGRSKSDNSLEMVPLDTTYSITDAIIEKNIIIHYGSTAALESILAGRISVLLTSPQNKIDKRIEQASVVFYNAQDALTFISNFSLNSLKSLNNSQKESIILNYGLDYSNIDTASLIAKIIEPMSVYNRDNFYSNFIFVFHYFLINLKGFLARMIKRSFVTNKIYTQKSLKFSREVILRELEKLGYQTNKYIIEIKRRGKQVIISKNTTSQHV